ncbi:hypothetical protein EST38_g7882 [Candolleomyces aberdarensis]|uniref:Uncharacterized protein n=1 Tax=Candolleomyces aberdarensis TaxID=2316362 RepID=A0A4V1Q3B2_9AGAR|nr:hypothetical protein EST38_g7882 [Candolleomyces aberdarensis]
MSAVLMGGVAVYAGGRQVHNDSRPAGKETEQDPTLAGGSLVWDQENLHSLVWGSNRSKVLSPTSRQRDVIRSPAVAAWLDGVALRDLQFHETHAACIDANGDVYQWGDGFFGDLAANSPPKLTLRGKNIVQLQLTGDKAYALSASGHIYVFAANVIDQVLTPGAPTPASDGWWGTGWLWGEDENIDFAQVTSNDKLNRREKFTSIAAGQSHLLALTSKGRAFAHPINKSANSHGQLGFQKFAVPDPAAAVTGKEAHLHLDLIPKSLSDPFWKASRSVRATSEAAPEDNLANVNDKNIRFCPYIYEIPSLRGVEFVQIAAGSRTSFGRTSNGRVLGWGANEFGQLGLGSSITLDTITVPSEVVLWRATPSRVSCECTDVTAGGDLSAFIVSRGDARASSHTDLLMSGNGQYGGLGNNVFTTAQSNASRVKAVSGLQQYNDKTQQMDPIKPNAVTIAPSGSVLVSINSAADSQGVGGSDLFVWGRNFDSELGNGKKSSLAGPARLEVPEGERMMLMERKAKEVRDLHGRVWKRGVRVKQHVAAGYGTSAVYWKIVD